MALRLSWPTPYGHTFTEAHAIIQDARLEKRIDKVWVEYDENEPGVPNPNNEWVSTKTYPVNYKVKIWISEDAYNDDVSFISGFNGRFEIDVAGTKNQYNIVKQCYVHLKAQDGWTDAVDC
jgi:hypothetical protein